MTAHASKQAGSTAIDVISRVGYASRGVVYVIAGVFAGLAALDLGGSTLSSGGVFNKVLQQPFGAVLLVLLALGLYCYAVWRVVQALIDPEDHGTDAKGLLKRIAFVVSGIVYIGLGTLAMSKVVGATGDEGPSRLDWLLSQTWGKVAVAIVGVGLIGAGIVQAVRAYQARFEKRLQTPSEFKGPVRWMCRFGLVTRAAAFVLSGGLTIGVALGFNMEAGGSEQLMDTVAKMPWGAVPLAIVALGFVAYGGYAFVQARWRETYAHRIW